MSRRGGDDCRIYIGNMPPDIRVKDVEDILYKFGKISHVDLKNSKKGAAYAFVQFEDPRDAADAVSDKDGYYYDGYSLRVEFPRGDGRSTFSGGSPRGRGRGGRGGPPSRRSENRVLVKDLPASGSWQDLKDHMREAGDVCYADVYNNGQGVVEYVKRDDMKYAIKKLNGSKFKSHENETSYIRLKEDRESRSRSRSTSPRRRSRRSPSYSSMS